MAEKPEERARAEIDRLLIAAGWQVQNVREANIHAVRGVALREFALKEGHGSADYLLYVDGKAAGVNVNYDVYRIRTQVGETGGKVDAGYYVDLRDKLTRKVRWEQLDEESSYDPEQLDRDVVAVDQIRTLVRTFRDRPFTEIFPGRTEVPKTLIFAKDDSHAENVVNIVREEFGKGNESPHQASLSPTCAVALPAFALATQ